VGKDLVKLMNFRNLFLILIVILITSASLYLTFNHGQSQHDLRGIANNSTAVQNTTVLGYAERILVDAKGLYMHAIAMNESYLVDLDNFSKELILNATFINSSTVAIGHAQYKYVILHVYYKGFDFTPQEIQENGIKVVLIPKPENVTYTGGWEYNYMITYDGKTYNVTLFSIGIMESSFYVLASTQKIGNLYVVQISITKELYNTLYVGELWLILTKS
jgi:hypothetical protein